MTKRRKIGNLGDGPVKQTKVGRAPLADSAFDFKADTSEPSKRRLRKYEDPVAESPPTVAPVDTGFHQTPKRGRDIPKALDIINVAPDTLSKNERVDSPNIGLVSRIQSADLQTPTETGTLIFGSDFRVEMDPTKPGNAIVNLATKPNDWQGLEVLRNDGASLYNLSVGQFRKLLISGPDVKVIEHGETVELLIDNEETTQEFIRVYIPDAGTIGSRFVWPLIRGLKIPNQITGNGRAITAPAVPVTIRGYIRGGDYSTDGKEFITIIVQTDGSITLQTPADMPGVTISPISRVDYLPQVLDFVVETFDPEVKGIAFCIALSRT